MLARDAATGRVAVAYPPALRRLLLEARHLDRMHFEVPPAALQAALQEGEHRRWGEALEGLLQSYYEVCGGGDGASVAVVGGAGG